MCLKGPRPVLQGNLEDVIGAISNWTFGEKKEKCIGFVRII